VSRTKNAGNVVIDEDETEMQDRRAGSMGLLQSKNVLEWMKAGSKRLTSESVLTGGLILA
jgi:hypothetical protein